MWEAHDGPWDANDIAPPDKVIEAQDPTHAAKLFAERHTWGNEIAVIVRDETGQYFEIELIQVWEIDMFDSTTLEKLCASKTLAPDSGNRG